MGRFCGVYGLALGKGDLSAPGTEPESGWGIRLTGRIRQGARSASRERPLSKGMSMTGSGRYQTLAIESPSNEAIEKSS